MKRYILMCLVMFALMVPAVAWGDSSHDTTTTGGDTNITNTNANTNVNQNSAMGGAGGTGIGIGGGANVENTNRNTNTFNPTNVNVNDPSFHNSNRQSQGQAQGQQQGQFQGQGQRQQQNNKQTIAPVQTVNEGDVPRQAPPAIAPNLVAVPETCMGSTSVGASSPFGGLSFGTTWKSEPCELRMFARSLQALGYNSAAIALLAQNENVAKALKAAGVAVPGQTAMVPSANPVEAYAGTSPDPVGQSLSNTADDNPTQVGWWCKVDSPCSATPSIRAAELRVQGKL